MTLSMRTETLDLRFAEPFHIARPEESMGVRTIALELDLEGATGLGECYPLAWYGETPETTLAVLPRLLGALQALAPLPAERVDVLAWLGRSTTLMGGDSGSNGAAKGGMDIALHDLAGAALGLPVWQLLVTSVRVPPT